MRWFEYKCCLQCAALSHAEQTWAMAGRLSFNSNTFMNLTSLHRLRDVHITPHASHPWLKFEGFHQPLIESAADQAVAGFQLLLVCKVRSSSSKLFTKCPQLRDTLLQSSGFLAFSVKGRGGFDGVCG